MIVRRSATPMSHWRLSLRLGWGYLCPGISARIWWMPWFPSHCSWHGPQSCACHTEGASWRLYRIADTSTLCAHRLSLYGARTFCAAACHACKQTSSRIDHMANCAAWGAPYHCVVSGQTCSLVFCCRSCKQTFVHPSWCVVTVDVEWHQWQEWDKCGTHWQLLHGWSCGVTVNSVLMSSFYHSLCKESWA